MTMTKPYKRSQITNGLRFRILERDGFRCRYCGKSPQEGAQLEVDHLLAVSNGGDNSEANLVASCFECNRGKRARVLPDRSSFLSWLRAQRLRDDPVGDLADDEQRRGLVEPTSYVDLCGQLRKAGASDDALRAAWDAWREWRRGGRPTRAVQSIRKDFLARIRATRGSTDYVWLSLIHI